MRQLFPKILAMLLACIWLVAGCESDSGTYQPEPSGDRDSLTDEPTNLSFHTLGNGSTDGNPAIVVLGWDAFVPVWAGAQPTVWTSVKLSLRGLALYNEDDGTTESFTFDSPKTFELFDTGEVRLKAYLPTEGSYSVLSLILEGQDGEAPFIASGTRNDSPVRFEADLGGAISLKKKTGVWQWNKGEEEAFVVALNLVDLNGAVDWTNLEPLPDGSYLIDVDSDGLLEKTISEAFLLVSDMNDNGQADDEETGEDNTLAQGDTAVYTICFPWEPNCYCDESGCRIIATDESSFFVELVWDQGNNTDFDLFLVRYCGQWHVRLSRRNAVPLFVRPVRRGYFLGRTLGGHLRFYQPNRQLGGSRTIVGRCGYDHRRCGWLGTGTDRDSQTRAGKISYRGSFLLGPGRIRYRTKPGNRDRKCLRKRSTNPTVATGLYGGWHSLESGGCRLDGRRERHVRDGPPFGDKFFSQSTGWRRKHFAARSAGLLESTLHLVRLGIQRDQ